MPQHVLKVMSEQNSRDDWQVKAIQELTSIRFGCTVRFCQSLIEGKPVLLKSWWRVPLARTFLSFWMRLWCMSICAAIPHHLIESWGLFGSCKKALLTGADRDRQAIFIWRGMVARYFLEWKSLSCQLKVQGHYSDAIPKNQEIPSGG